MLGDDPEAKAEFEALAQQEMEVWKSIVSGAAVMEHMEDKYHDMLKVMPITCTPLGSLKEGMHEPAAGNSNLLIATSGFPFFSFKDHGATRCRLRMRCPERIHVPLRCNPLLAYVKGAIRKPKAGNWQGMCWQVCCRLHQSLLSFI